MDKKQGFQNFVETNLVGGGGEVKHALSRALSTFATGPQREGQAALVHIKIFCMSVRRSLGFFCGLNHGV